MKYNVDLGDIFSYEVDAIVIPANCRPCERGGLDKIAYKTEAWNEYSGYSFERARIYDYLGVPDFNENKELYDSLNIITTI